jgi:hypothetical protein
VALIAISARQSVETLLQQKKIQRIATEELKKAVAEVQ